MSQDKWRDLEKKGMDLEDRMLQEFSAHGWECQRAHEKGSYHYDSWLPQECLWVAEPGASSFERNLVLDGCSQFAPDITLLKNGRTIGLVECYLLENLLDERKLKQIEFELNVFQPEVLVITNGTMYETYIDGRYIGTMRTPISYEMYRRRNELSTYIKKRSLKKTGGRS